MSSDLGKISVETKPKLDVTVEMDIATKWKKITYNKRILRWKLFKELQHLLNTDFDKFVTDISDNEKLIEELLHVTNNYECIKEDTNDHLKYGLEDTHMWQEVMNKDIDGLNEIKKEYENSLFEKSTN